MRYATMSLAAIVGGGCATNPPRRRVGTDASVVIRRSGVHVTPADFDADRLADVIACELGSRLVNRDSLNRTDSIALTGANQRGNTARQPSSVVASAPRIGSRSGDAKRCTRTSAMRAERHTPHSLRFTERHMLHHRSMLTLVAIAALAISPPVIAQQSGMMQGTQQQHMQQHMTQMQDMMGRMSDMSQRSQQMQQQMKQQMGQMQGGQMSAAQMAMPQMADHMSAMTTQMKGLMGQMQSMMKDQQMMKDRTMQHDMDDMHEHTAAMSKDMDKMLQSMERVQKHIGAPAPQPKKP